jgi:hypothetical protein
MNHRRTLKLMIFTILVIFTLSCSLGSVGSGRNTPQGSKDSPATVNASDFTGDVSAPVVRKDKTKFAADKFAARSLPVVIAFSGKDTAQILLKGAIVQPNWAQSPDAPEFMDILYVLQLDLPNLLSQESGKITSDRWQISGVATLLDANGNILSSLERKRYDVLYPGYAQVFRFFWQEVPKNAQKVNLTLSLEKVSVSLSCANPSGASFCATAEDINFRVPQPIAYHTPIQLNLRVEGWSARDTNKAVLAEYFFGIKNPFNQEMDIKTCVLFLDSSDKVVGWSELEDILKPNSTDERSPLGVTSKSSYLAGIPVKAMIFHDAKFTDLIKAARK